MQRRDFLATAAACGAFSTISTMPSAVQAAESVPGDRRAEAKLRICSQLRPWIPGKGDAEKMAQMKTWGMEAVEAGRPIGGNTEKAKEFKKMADDAGLKISVICWGACDGELCSANPEEQKGGIDKLKKALECAAVLECVGVIYVPAFNNHQARINRTNQEIRTSLIDIDPRTKEVKGGFLKEVGDFAAGMKTNVILEPLCRMEAFFLRQIGDAASICRDCQSEGVRTMGDFYHMYFEENDDMGAFISGGKFVKHVHFGSGVKRILPGQDPGHSFVSGFRGLKYIGYQDFMSFECGCLGGNEKGAEEVPKTLDFIKKSWAEA